MICTRRVTRQRRDFGTASAHTANIDKLGQHDVGAATACAVLPCVHIPCPPRLREPPSVFMKSSGFGTGSVIAADATETAAATSSVERVMLLD